VVTKLLWLALAGTLGTWSRYLLGGLVQNRAGGSFPFGTVAVNLLGCLAFGLVWGAMQNRLHLGADITLIVLIGFMGAFTTFSTFAFETSDMLAQGKWLNLTLYVLAHNVLGIALMLLGMKAGQLL